MRSLATKACSYEFSEQDFSKPLSGSEPSEIDEFIDTTDDETYLHEDVMDLNEDESNCDDEQEEKTCSYKNKMDSNQHDSDFDTESEDEERPPEFFLAGADAINRSNVVRSDYSPSLTLTLDKLQDLWGEYCSFVRKTHQMGFRSITLGDITKFFDWKLGRKRNANGRRLRGTKISTSLETDWKNFRLVFERVRRRKLNPRVNRQMHEMLRKLAKDHGLSNEKRGKAPMDVEDVREVLQTALTTTEKRFPIGRYRILTCFFLQGAFITANRPAALLNLQYRHIAVTILRDPKGGPHRILLEFTFEFTKTYLGAKEANTFPIPEIIFDPSLILSPHVFLLGLMFADDVFLAPTLKCPEDLSRLKIRQGRNSLPIPLSPKKANKHVFRRCKRGSNGFEMTDDQLPVDNIRQWMKNIGEIAGFLQVARPYSLRYGSGKAFDDNGQVSDALRNLMMQHAKTDTFLKHYLSRRVTVDTQAIVRGLVPQEELMRAACRMSRWIDPDRPRKLTPEQSSSVNDDPAIKKLIRRREKMKRKPSRAAEYKRLGLEISNTRQRLRHALRIKIRREWDHEQAVRDIEQQLAGFDPDLDVKTKLNESDHWEPEHKLLIESILSLPGSNLEREILRRNTAINAVIAYCQIEEEPLHRQKRYQAALSVPNTSKEETYDTALEAAKKAVYEEKRPKICFLCLGNENLSINQRVHSFGSPGDLTKHFKRKHLSCLRPEDSVVCPLCKVPLEHKMHFRNHALTRHGTVS